MKIYTKTGDAGETSLFGAGRVPKDHLRVEAYGCVDELNAALGLAVAFESTLSADLIRYQHALFELGAELATPSAERQRNAGISESDIDQLEQSMDRMEAALPVLKSFILPGGTRASGFLHQARTLCRRAERRCVSLQRDLEHQKQPPLRATLIAFLNRLSDWLFVAARYENLQAKRPDVLWEAK